MSIFSREGDVVERSLEYTSIPDQRIGSSKVQDIIAVTEEPGYKVEATFNGTEDLYTKAMSAEGLPRGKSGLRILFEIINELKTNYNLEGGLSWYDIISRMKQSEYYTSHFLDNCELTYDYLKNGGLGTKIFSDYKKDAVIQKTKTRLKSKKDDSVLDKFLPIKGVPILDPRTGNPIGDDKDNYNLIKPPTETEPPTLVAPEDIAQADDRASLTPLVFNNFNPIP